MHKALGFIPRSARKQDLASRILGLRKYNELRGFMVSQLSRPIRGRSAKSGFVSTMFHLSMHKDDKQTSGRS
jgi:hypothetical protein